MLEESPAASLLRGTRGKGPYDLEAACDAIVRFAALAVATNGILKAIEINPLIRIGARKRCWWEWMQYLNASRDPHFKSAALPMCACTTPFVDGHQRDYYCRVVEDCVGGSSLEAHQASLNAMEYLQAGARRPTEVMMEAFDAYRAKRKAA